MQRLLSRIDERTAAFSRHPFFLHLEGSGTRADVDAMVPGLTFFILSFQDMLRLNEERVVDPELHAIVRQQRQDDAGHDRWFVHDLRALQLEPPLEWIFGPHHQVARDISFELITEIYRARHDAVRLVIPIVLESTSAVYFSRVYGFFERSGIGVPDGRLRFFSRSHWNAEQSHDLFRPEQQKQLLAMRLPNPVVGEAERVVDGMFGCFDRLVTHLCERMPGAAAGYAGALTS